MSNNFAHVEPPAVPQPLPALKWEGPDEDGYYSVELTGFPKIAFSGHGKTPALALHMMGEQLTELLGEGCELCAVTAAPPAVPQPDCETSGCQHRGCVCGHIECGHANENVQPNCSDCHCDGFKLESGPPAVQPPQKDARQQAQDLAEEFIVKFPDDWKPVADLLGAWFHTAMQMGALMAAPPALSVSQPPQDHVEALAAYAHEAWSGWMRYLFSQCWLRDGTATMPSEWRTRWERQMNTPYAELREDEKESDRKEARRMLEILSPLPVSPPPQPTQGLPDWCKCGHNKILHKGQTGQCEQACHCQQFVSEGVEPPPTQELEHEHEGELCWTPRQMDAINELLKAERERIVSPQPTQQEKKS